MHVIAQTYRYLHPSTISDSPRPKLTLATCDCEGKSHPYFFEGRILRPRLVAELLRSVYQIVESRFFTPPAMVAKILALADPVVTSGGGLLRFEGFSSCCSTYVRADLLPAIYDGDVVGKGTTNVDFNAPMRAAIAGVRDETGLALSVGRDALRLRSAGAEVIERKVSLPSRWVRGMLEVQSYQSVMGRRFAVSPVQALSFLRTLPRASTSRTPLWIAPGASGLYATTRAVEGAVRIADVRRLRVLQALLPCASALVVYSDDEAQASAWVLDFGAARLTIVLSAEVWRGFSGEGQALHALMRSDADAMAVALAKVRAQLQWQAALDSGALAAGLDLDQRVADDALRVLGVSGLVGYDLFDGRYFHRVLPFDLSMLADLHPRLADAKALADSGAVSVIRDEPVEATVTSGGAAHRVREAEGELRCTCPWFARYQGDRGPCKHVLATMAATRRAKSHAV